jgi:hypothetical protein
MYKERTAELILFIVHVIVTKRFVKARFTIAGVDGVLGCFGACIMFVDDSKDVGVSVGDVGVTVGVDELCVVAYRRSVRCDKVKRDGIDGDIKRAACQANQSALVSQDRQDQNVGQRYQQAHTRSNERAFGYNA